MLDLISVYLFGSPLLRKRVFFLAEKENKKNNVKALERPGKDKTFSEGQIQFFAKKLFSIENGLNQADDSLALASLEDFKGSRTNSLSIKKNDEQEAEPTYFKQAKQPQSE